MLDRLGIDIRSFENILYFYFDEISTYGTYYLLHDYLNNKLISYSLLGISMGESMRRYSALTCPLAVLGFAALAGGAGAQTTNYRYDGRGRLSGLTVTRPGGTVTTDITYDKADNRIKYSVSGQTNSGSGGSNQDGDAGASAPSGSTTKSLVVVTPLNGFTVIQIN